MEEAVRFVLIQKLITEHRSLVGALLLRIRKDWVQFSVRRPGIVTFFRDICLALQEDTGYCFKLSSVYVLSGYSTVISFDARV